MLWHESAKCPGVTTPSAIVANPVSQLWDLSNSRKDLVLAIVFGKAGQVEAGRMMWHASWFW